MHLFKVLAGYLKRLPNDVKSGYKEMMRRRNVPRISYNLHS